MEEATQLCRIALRIGAHIIHCIIRLHRSKLGDQARSSEKTGATMASKSSFCTPRLGCRYPEMRDCFSLSLRHLHPKAQASNFSSPRHQPKRSMRLSYILLVATLDATSAASGTTLVQPSTANAVDPATAHETIGDDRRFLRKHEVVEDDDTGSDEEEERERLARE
ncbi:uncharacterized protein KRP23_3965 [Phytophthora ramorum]|uniref:uncharacterized protein n=1 Tax=Phytophthora ramorum TaxID=164328 RepID=UPI00309A645D|nr:hypothetical protein KRP23_3965 [Phytophthora ramorum]